MRQLDVYLSVGRACDWLHGWLLLAAGVLQDVSAVLHHHDVWLRRQLVPAQRHGVRRRPAGLRHHQLHRR